MLTSYKDADVLNKFYYDHDEKLMRRISMWNNFGTNNTTYGEFLHSLIKRKYDNYADMGCGNAFYTSHLLDYVNNEAHFVDSSSTILEDARVQVTRQNKSSNVKTFFHSSDLTKTGFLNQKFDLVTLMHVLQHVSNLELAFQEIKRITRKGGEIIITTYNNSLDDWLNRTHYSLIEKLSFPEKMLEKDDYLKFSGENAFELLKRNFSDIERCDYKNDAIISDKDILLDYYESAMMYRMSKGEDDNRISGSKWGELRDAMNINIEKELANKGSICIQGNVTAFRVLL